MPNMTAVLRQLLQRPEIIVTPGAYDGLTAKLIEREGFASLLGTRPEVGIVSCGVYDGALGRL
jgi:2-methylisocitrate lyase-like PEP mutase family enzyme